MVTVPAPGPPGHVAEVEAEVEGVGGIRHDAAGLELGSRRLGVVADAGSVGVAIIAAQVRPIVGETTTGGLLTP
jgi:hypothetical protein